MQKKNRIYLFIFNRMPILVLLIPIIILLGTTIVIATDQKGTTKSKGESGIQVKIPEGLYLYKPDFSKDAVSPLVLVKDGKLLDPYTLAKEIGISSFSNQYIANKTFYAYSGSELYGKISNLSLISDYGCITEEFVPYIRWVGHFEGKPLPHGWLAEKSVEGIRYHVFGSTKVIFTPQPLKVSKSPTVFPVTERDMEMMVKAVQKNLIPSAIEQINKRLKKENRKIIGEGASRLDVVEAFDLNGDGKKDMLGVYYFSAKHDNPKGYWAHDILFVLWDSGTIERIASMNRSPAYMIGGILDIDQDGVQELILITSVGPEVEDGDDGVRIDILSHGATGWTSIYHTKCICGPSCSDAYSK